MEMNKQQIMLFVLIFILSITNNVRGAKEDQVVKLFAVGSFQNAAINPRNQMMLFAAEQINQRNDILPDATINMYPNLIFFT